MEIIGKQLEVGLGVEAIRGTKASSSKWIKNVSAGIIEKAEHVQDESSRGRFEDMDGRRVIKKFIEGDLECYLYADSFGFLAYNLYGAVSSSLVATGVYDHIFSLNQGAIKPSLTIFAKDGDAQQLAFKNGHISSLELTASVDSYVSLTASMKAKDGEDDTSTPNYDSEFDFIGKDITLKIADTEAGLTTAAPLCIKEVSLTLDTGLLDDYCLGSEYPADYYTSKMSIEGSFQKNFEDETFKDLFASDTAKYMEIKIEGDTPITGVYKPSITLRMNKVMISNWERSGGKDELVVEDVEFKAFYNATDEEQSTLTLRNATDEYEISTSA